MIADLAIYGAGGLGREFALMVKQINASREQWNLIGFFDDGKRVKSKVDGFSVLGGVDDLNATQKPISIVFAIADPLTRMTIAKKVVNELVEYPVLIHPHCITGSDSNILGKGTVITAGCILTTNIVLGEFNIINLSSTVGHDVKTGNFVSVMPGCNVSGNVSIGEGTLLGTGSRILQNLKVGRRCKIGAGAIVTKSFEDDLTIIGMPASVKKTLK